jgi:hypothetical protein
MVPGKKSGPAAAGLFLLLISLFLPSPAAAQASPWPLIAGTAGGLYGLDLRGNSSPLWLGGGVRKIIKAGSAWALLTDLGIMVSPDLRTWESRNQGLPVKTIKDYQGGIKTLIRQVQEIKDLEIDPANPEIMTCAVKDAVFLSRDGGRSWKSLGFPPFRTDGVKAVAAASLPAQTAGAPPELTVLCSHAVYGVYYYQPDGKTPRWTELNAGLEKLPSTGNPDEVSDLAVTLSVGAAPEIYAAQSFRGRVYRLDWAATRFIPLWSDGAEFGTADSLDPGRGGLRFIHNGEILEIAQPSAPAAPANPRRRQDILDIIRSIPGNLGKQPSCLLFWENVYNPRTEIINLSELWLLDSGDHPKAAPAGNREGLYLPVNHAMDPYSLAPYLKTLEEKRLNMVVIDMKDDYGRLRFTPKNPGITEKGRVFRPVDIDSLLKDLKARGIYTAARIVVFKDPELARKEGGRYAVWDTRTSQPWAGYYDTRQKAGTGAPADSAYKTAVLPSGEKGYEILRTWYDEQWVDPYSEAVWDYNAAIARELHERGFDEIQFDYIRFPTDGENLSAAQYRWRDQGMDMDSAIMSFLRHVRSQVSAPISVDIYGANGWYRTGARTGQEVELLAPYVDVICPMYYPSHFEQDFLAQDPPELRPYRIYNQGARRTAVIARNRVIVRPYVQAFFLNVSYDRKYYNPEYVRLEVQGLRDAGKGGLIYWNNSGRYEDIPGSETLTGKQ